MIIPRTRPVLPTAEAGYFREVVRGALTARQADAVGWCGAYRHRPCALLQVPWSESEMLASPIGHTELHQITWTAGPLVSHYVVDFGYQATRRPESGSETVLLAAGVKVDGTLRRHVGGAAVDAGPGVRWDVADGTLETRTEVATRNFHGIEMSTNLSYPMVWASTTARIEAAPAVLPTRPRVFNASGEAGVELRLELDATNVRICMVRVLEFAGVD